MYTDESTGDKGLFCDYSNCYGVTYRHSTADVRDQQCRIFLVYFRDYIGIIAPFYGQRGH